MNHLKTLLERLSEPQEIKPLPAPIYSPNEANYGKIALAVESMRTHMTDEGWQIMLALQHAGYELWGYKLPHGETDVKKILKQKPDTGIVVVQDKREWDVPKRSWREYRARFTNIEYLAQRTDIFKITILKDSHQRPLYHRQSAEEIGCHAWIIYYHPYIVAKLAPYVRPQHLIRTYHSLDPKVVPPFRPAKQRKPCIFTGAISSHYPLRARLYRAKELRALVNFHRHPGYHRRGCFTPEYFKLLNRYKVSICTCSKYGYALRKIIESTAAGCRVITDLPVEDKLPEIDDNLIRISPDATPTQVRRITDRAVVTYNEERQKHYAELAINYYDYHHLGKLLAEDIEKLKNNYNKSAVSDYKIQSDILYCT